MEIKATVVDSKGNVYVAVAEKLNFIFTNVSPFEKNEIIKETTEKFINKLI